MKYRNSASLKPLCVSVSLTLVSLLLSASVFAETLNFQQALQRAEQKSPDYGIAKQNQLQAELAYKNAWSSLLPAVDLEAQHFYNHGGTSLFSTSTPSSALLAPLPATWSNNLGITISENLYDNGDTIRQIKIDEASRQIGRLSSAKGLQQLYLNVAKAYYAYSLAVEGLNLQDQEIEAIRKEFETIRGRYRQGVNSNRDFLRIKAQLQRSEIDFANQKINVEAALQTLRLAIGEKEAVDFLPFQPADQQLDMLEFPKITPEETLDFRMARLQNDISELKYEATKREEWPRLSLKSSYSYNDPQYIGPSQQGEEPYWNFQVALVLDYSIWDWGIRNRKTQIADAQKLIEYDQQESIRLSVQQDLNKLYAQIDSLKKSYVESKQVMKDENDVYNSLNRGYHEGKVNYIDLITALQELYASRSQFLTLQYNLLSARAALAFYQGNLREKLITQ